MTLDGSQFADVLGPTVVVAHPRRRAVVERPLELRRRHQDVVRDLVDHGVVRDLVDDGATTTKLRFRLERVQREVHLPCILPDSRRDRGSSLGRAFPI